MVTEFFRKAIVFGLLVLAGAALVNLLLLSWHHPSKESNEVVVASILTSILLIIVVSIAIAVIIRSMSEQDGRVNELDERLETLEARGVTPDTLNASIEAHAASQTKRLNDLKNEVDSLPSQKGDLEALSRTRGT